MKIANTARPRMRPPPPLRNENELEQRVRQLGRRDDRQRKAGEQQDQDVDVAQRAAAPDGEADHRGAGDETRDTNGGKIHGGAESYSSRPPHRMAGHGVSLDAITRLTCIVIVVFSAFASVAVAAPPWSAPQTVSSSSLFVDNPDVVVSADGRALATWRWSGPKPAAEARPAVRGSRCASPAHCCSVPSAVPRSFVTPLITYGLERVVGLDTRQRGRAAYRCGHASANSKGEFRPATAPSRPTPIPASRRRSPARTARWRVDRQGVPRAPHRAGGAEVRGPVPPSRHAARAAAGRTTSLRDRRWASCSSPGNAAAWSRRASSWRGAKWGPVQRLGRAVPFATTFAVTGSGRRAYLAWLRRRRSLPVVRVAVLPAAGTRFRKAQTIPQDCGIEAMPRRHPARAARRRAVAPPRAHPGSRRAAGVVRLGRSRNGA